MVNQFESSSPATPRLVAGRVGWRGGVVPGGPGGGGWFMGGFGLVSEYLRVLYIVLMICLLTG